MHELNYSRYALIYVNNMRKCHSLPSAAVHLRNSTFVRVFFRKTDTILCVFANFLEWSLWVDGKNHKQIEHPIFLCSSFALVQLKIGCPAKPSFTWGFCSHQHKATQQVNSQLKRRNCLSSIYNRFQSPLSAESNVRSCYIRFKQQHKTVSLELPGGPCVFKQIFATLLFELQILQEN